jgi:hypothetical protein
MADTANVFGVDVPSPDPAAVAAVQQSQQQLRRAAQAIRAAVGHVSDPATAELALRIADLADAAARGDTPDLGAAVREVADFISGHPAFFGSQISSVTGLGVGAVVKVMAAIDAISQVTDASSAAFAVDATADAVGQTGTLVAVIAGVLVGAPVGFAIATAAIFVTTLGHHVAEVIRPPAVPPPATPLPDGTSAAHETRDPDDDNTDNPDAASQVTQTSGTDQPGTSQSGTDQTVTDSSGTDGPRPASITDEGHGDTGPIDAGPDPGHAQDLGHSDGVFHPKAPAQKKDADDT